MKQSRLISAIEALTNIVVGLGVAMAAHYAGFIVLEIPFSFKQLLGITAWMTVVSFLRSYFIRRYFETHLKQIARNVAKALNRIKALLFDTF